MIFTVDKTSDDNTTESVDISSIEELLSFIGTTEKQRVVIFTDGEVPHIEIYDDFRE